VGVCDLLFEVPAANACLTRLHRLQHIVRWSPRGGGGGVGAGAGIASSSSSGSGGGGGSLSPKIAADAAGASGDDTDVLTAFWELSAIVNQALGQALARANEFTKEQYFACVRVTERVLKKRNAFLEVYFKEGDSTPAKHAFHRSLTPLETGLLVTLPHRDPELVSLCVTALSHLIRAVEITRETTSDFSANLDTYRALCRDTLTMSGPASQQKAIAKALREAPTVTPANEEAWSIIYQRWQRYTSHILFTSWSATGQTKPPSSQTRLPPVADSVLANSGRSIDDITREWSNYSGFLIALSSVAINKDVTVKDKSKDKEKGKKTTVVMQTTTLAYQFVYDLLELFTNEYDQPTRDTVTQLIGQYIPRDVMVVFFVTVYQNVSNLVTSSGQVMTTPQSTLLVEQSIVCVKKVLESLLPHSFSHLTNLEQLLEMCAKYISQLVLSERALRIKMKYCTLIDTVMEYRSQIIFKNPSGWRMFLVESILLWMSDYVDLSKEQVATTQNEEIEKLKTVFAEVDVHCMRTCATLLRGLNFETMSEKSTLTVVTPAELTSAPDQNAVVKYFNFFEKVLARCRKEREANQRDNTKRALVKYTILALSHLLSANINSALQYFASMGYHENLETRRAFLKVITHILQEGTSFDAEEKDPTDTYEALVEVLCDNDLLLAQALLQVTAITEQDEVSRLLVNVCESLDSSLTVTLLRSAIRAEIAKTEAVASLFRRNSIATKLITAYTKVVGAQYLAQTLRPPLRQLLSKPRNYELDPGKLLPGESREVNLKNVVEASTLFLNAIRESLGWCPAQLYELCAFIAEEVRTRFDENNATSDGSSSSSAEELSTPSPSPSPSVPNSTSAAPAAPVSSASPSVASASLNTAESDVSRSLSAPSALSPRGTPRPKRAEDKPGTSSDSLKYIQRVSVGGVMFLRFFCPAIVAPRSFDLINEKLSPQLERGLVLVTKVLQNLANMQLFQKEPYMNDLNPFLQTNMSHIEALFDKFAQIPANVSRAQVVISEAQRREDLGQLHRHLHTNIEQLSKVLREWKAAEGHSAQTIEARLRQVLAKLGPPPEKGTYRTDLIKAVTKTNTLNEAFLSFLKTMEGTNVDALREKRIFYKQGQTKDGVALFYYIAHRYQATINHDAFLYLVLKTLEPHLDKPFALVIDATGFDHEHEYDHSSFRKLVKHLPYSAEKNFKAIYILHPSKVFKDYLSHLSSYISKSAKKMMFFSSVRDFLVKANISDSENALPPSTNALENEVKYTFAHVNLRKGVLGQGLARQQGKEYTLRVSKTSLHVISNKPTTILSCPVPSLINVYPLRWVVEASRVESEFQVRLLRGVGATEETLAFKAQNSSQAEEIVQAIQTMKKGYDMVMNPVTSRTSSTSTKTSVERVPGTLLNMALLNLTQQHSQHIGVSVREAAYNLLVAVAETFNFQVHTALLRTNGLYIPTSSSHFTTEISRRISQTEVKLTLDFLSECVRNLMGKEQPGTKLFCLDYMSPWLPNLSEFVQHDKLERLRQFLLALVDLTVRESLIRPAILSKVWERISESCSLDTLEIVIDQLLVRAIQLGIAAPELPMLGEILVSLAMHKPQFVAGKVVAKTLRVLMNVASPQECAPSMRWPALLVLIRLVLTLSFANLIDVAHYLPELFHFIVMLAGTGNVAVRMAIYCLLINTVHSVYCTLNSEHVPLLPLIDKITEFGEPQFRLLFGIAKTPGQKINPFQDIKDLRAEDRPYKITMTNLEVVVDGLVSVLKGLNSVAEAAQSNEAAAPSPLSLYALQWHTRWLSLTLSAAYGAYTTQQSPRELFSLPARAFVALGALSRPRDVDDMFFERVLIALRQALRVLEGLYNEEQLDYLIALVMCLARLVPYISPASRFYAPLFWLALILTTISDTKLFAAAITLLDAILRHGDERGVFDTDGVTLTLLNVRKRDNLYPTLHQLDSITGVSVDTSFSFAVASHLLKGLKENTLKTDTSRVLLRFVQLVCKGGSDTLKETAIVDCLGYLAVLLPTMSAQDRLSLRETYTGESLPSNTSPSNVPFFFTHNLVPDVTHAALLFAMLALNLTDNDKEHECLFIYDALLEGSKHMPHVLPVTYDWLLPKMEQTILTTQNVQLMERIVSLNRIIFGEQMAKIPNDQKITRRFLKQPQFNFGGLPECIAFGKLSIQRQQAIKRLPGEFLDAILSS
jgi:hypothetical protein